MSDTADLFADDVQPSAADGVQTTDPDEAANISLIRCDGLSPVKFD